MLKKQPLTKQEIKKQKRDASKLMHDIQKRVGKIDESEELDYCLCCGSDLPKSHFLYPKK